MSTISDPSNGGQPVTPVPAEGTSPSPKSEAAVSTEGPKTKSSGAPQRALLVVDDEMGPRQSLHMVFKEDYDVLLADSGEKAIEMARLQRVDAAVLDIRMAGMSGVELLAKLKEMDPRMEIIMLTAYETIETARQALRLGACDYLTKPFDLTSMRSAVIHAMDRRVLSDQREANIRRLAELQKELQNQKLQEEIIRAKGEIYASVLHDINGPLTIISGFIEIINQHIKGASTVEGESLELIKDRLTRVTLQVNNCIDISQRYLSFLRRPTQAGMVVSTRQALQDMGELLKVHRSLQKNELVLDIAPDDIMAEINGACLIQLLVNLAVNALQSSSDPHRVEVSSRKRTTPVDLEAIVDGEECYFFNRDGFANRVPLVEITVKDDGSGIKPEVLSEIFQPKTFDEYFSSRADRGGHGLGMAIVQRFIKESDGGLQVVTQVGQGSTFTVYLPARD